MLVGSPAERLVARRLGGPLADGGVDRCRIASDGAPVGPGRVPERVAHQVDDAHLHDRLRPDDPDRVGQTLQPVAHGEEHVPHAPILQLGEDRRPVPRALRGRRAPDAEHVPVSLQVHADGRVERAVGGLPVARLVISNASSRSAAHAPDSSRFPGFAAAPLPAAGFVVMVSIVSVGMLITGPFPTGPATGDQDQLRTSRDSPCKSAF